MPSSSPSTRGDTISSSRCCTCRVRRSSTRFSSDEASAARRFTTARRYPMGSRQHRLTDLHLAHPRSLATLLFAILLMGVLSTVCATPAGAQELPPCPDADGDGYA